MASPSKFDFTLAFAFLLLALLETNSTPTMPPPTTPPQVAPTLPSLPLSKPPTPTSKTQKTPRLKLTFKRAASKPEPSTAPSSPRRPRPRRDSRLAKLLAEHNSKPFHCGIPPFPPVDRSGVAGSAHFCGFEMVKSGLQAPPLYDDIDELCLRFAWMSFENFD